MFASCMYRMCHSIADAQQNNTYVFNLNRLQQCKQTMLAHVISKTQLDSKCINVALILKILKSKHHMIEHCSQ